MTQQELLTCLHQYTPWEELHLQNRFNHVNITELNQTLEHPVSDAERGLGLHRPAFPDSALGSYSEDFFFQGAEDNDIMLVQHDRYTPPVLHNHNFYELLYVYEGEFTQQIDNTQFTMHTGDFCLVPPRVYHSLEVDNYSIILNILIKKSAFQNIFFNVLRGDNILSAFFLGNTYSKNVNNYIIFHTNGDLKIQNLVLDMCLEAVNKERYYMQMLHTNLLLIFSHLLRNYEKTCVMPTIKKKKDIQDFGILRYVDESYQTLTLPKLAEHFHFSAQYMSHRLKQITGMSFTEYILMKRMEEAARLLIGTNIKIKEIAENIGYHNQEHFIRSFRKYYDVSPSEYRGIHLRD